MKTKMLLIILFISAFLMEGLSALNLNKTVSGVLTVFQKPAIKYISTSEIDELYKQAVENTLKNDPDFFKKQAQIFGKQISLSNSIGDTIIFNAVNLSDNSIYTLDAVLKAIGINTQIWVEVSSWDSGFVDQHDVNDILDNLEEHTGITSINSSKGIFEIDTTYFGNPPNYDGDNIVDFLILDIKDGWSGEGGFTAGYFAPNDQQPAGQNGSNGRDMLYLDSKPGISYNLIHNISNVMGTAAHEFQHLIHYHYDQNEPTWVNEAMSQLAATYCGYGVYNPSLFFNDPNEDLTFWGGDVYDYSQVNLWSLYMAEQFGPTFIKNVVQNTMNGIDAINSVMSNMEIQNSFDESYTDWILCNYINDTSVDPKWGYVHSDMTGLRANVEKSILNYPETVLPRYVDHYGAMYYKFGNGDSLSLQFNSQNAFAKIIKYYLDAVEVCDINAGEHYYDNDFGDEVVTEILVVGNKKEKDTFNFIVDAQQSNIIKELSYDDGEPDLFSGSYSFLGAGDNSVDYGWANVFSLPSEDESHPLYLKIYVSTNSGAVNIHLWGDSKSSPGPDLITPFPDTLYDGWNEIAFPVGEQIILPQTFYFGFTHADNKSNVYVGMDNTHEENYTWFIRPEGTDLRVNNPTLSSLDDDYKGYNMMIRAIIECGRGSEVSIKEYPPVVLNYSLSQNYPNPFNPNTTISYTIPKKSHVKITIFDIYGHEITTLKNSIEPEGYNSVVWNSCDESGCLVPSGLYIYKITSNNFKVSGKMLLIK